MLRTLGRSNLLGRVVSVDKSGLRVSIPSSSRMMFSSVEALKIDQVNPDLIGQFENISTKEDETNMHRDQFGRTFAFGRRKTSMARVWLKPGTGLCTVNGKTFMDFFQTTQRIYALEPFNATGTSCLYDVLCTVEGGGISGQAGAVRLAISRALEKQQSELRPPLRKGGFLTRDSRMVERKKPGLKKARKQYQWVKR